MSYITISKEVDVDIDMEDFDTDELIAELKKRGAGTSDQSYGDGTQVLQAIYEKRRLGKDYQADLDQLIWMSLGKTL